MGKSAEGAKMASLLRGTKAAMVIKDGPVVIRMKYVGSGTVTSVTNDISTDLELITSDGGIDTYAYATYATVGALVDAVNGDGIFEARILDGLRSDATDDMFVDGAMTVTSAGYYDLLQDTSASFSLAYRCAYDRNVKSNIPAGNHRVSLQDFTYYATLGNAAINDVQVWEYNPSDNTETQVYQALSVSAAATDVTFASGYGEITAGYGNELIVVLVDDTSLSDTSAFLQVRYDRE